MTSFQEWLNKYELPRNQLLEQNICAFVAFKGQLDFLNFLISSGLEWNGDTLTQAALAGHLKILMYLEGVSLHPKWDELTCVGAAYGGHLETLKFLRSRQCPWNEEVCFYAAQQGHLDLLQWSRENGCPWNKSACEKEAKDFPKILEWLKTQAAFYEDEVREELVKVIKMMGEDPSKFLK